MNIGDNISFNARIRFNNRIADIPKKNKSSANFFMPSDVLLMKQDKQRFKV